MNAYLDSSFSPYPSFSPSPTVPALMPPFSSALRSGWNQEDGFFSRLRWEKALQENGGDLVSMLAGPV